MEAKIIDLISFGFKYERPSANICIDVTWMNNPARNNSWTLFSEIDEEMILWVIKQEGFREIANDTKNLLSKLCNYDIIRFAAGCSSGRHRSPIFIEYLSYLLHKINIKTTVMHNEVKNCLVFDNLRINKHIWSL